MDVLRQMLETVRTYLGRLNATHKLLIGSLVVIAMMTLAFVALYAGRARMIELLPGVGAPDQARAAAFLTAASVPNQLRADGKLMVSTEREAQARALLAENGKLPGDKSIMFDTLLTRQSWLNSRQQNEQLFLIALQNQLAADIASFKGVRSATVMLDVPEAAGIGRLVRQPSASVTVVTRDGTALAQGTVDAIAGYVAGSRAGLDIERVRVIDAATGKQRKATSESDALSTTYLEHATRVENQTRDKIADLLSYIPGVVVAVTAQVDVTRVNSQTTQYLPEGQGTLSTIRRSTEDTQTSTQTSPGSEGGLMSNIGADVSKARASPGSSQSTSKTDAEFQTSAGSKTETVIDPKGMPTMVAVSVNIPRNFVGLLLSQGAGDAGATPPTDEQIAQKFTQAVKPQVEAVIRPHVRLMTQQANRALSDADLDRLVQQAVSVALMPVDLPLASTGTQSAGMLGGVAGTLGLGSAGSLIEKAVLGVLSVVALAMMFVMVKRSGKRAELPTAEELVGLPPTLEAPGDLIGEAEEGEAFLEGIEVGEEKVKKQQMLDQVGKLVEGNPQSAAKLLNRWMQSVEE